MSKVYTFFFFAEEEDGFAIARPGNAVPVIHVFLSLDGLYCEEDPFDEDLKLCGFQEEEEANETVKNPFALFEHDLFWDDDELERLFSKEKEFHLGQRDLSSNGSLMAAKKRSDADYNNISIIAFSRANFEKSNDGLGRPDRYTIDWILRTNGHYGFTTMTAVLAANYFDRFISTFSFLREKRWMSQLFVVACLSLAVKVEKTEVPHLLDLQVEESKFVFEVKTI